MSERHDLSMTERNGAVRYSAKQWRRKERDWKGEERDETRKQEHRQVTSRTPLQVLMQFNTTNKHSSQLG